MAGRGTIVAFLCTLPWFVDNANAFMNSAWGSKYTVPDSRIFSNRLLNKLSLSFRRTGIASYSPRYLQSHHCVKLYMTATQPLKQGVESRILSPSRDQTQVLYYDTTLRDGAQGEGISLSCDDKLRIALRLHKFGVHYIEGGYVDYSKPFRFSYTFCSAFKISRMKDKQIHTAQ